MKKYLLLLFCFIIIFGIGFGVYSYLNKESMEMAPSYIIEEPTMYS